MPLPRAVAQRLPVLVTACSALVGLLGALALRDRVRLVDILSLFFGGVGTGAGLTETIVRRRLAAREAAARSAAAGPPARPWGPPPGLPPGLHTPPTVPWRPAPAEQDGP
ncbi:hypothetical protein [Roseisolibacter agri]|uniref:Uncharacterized protein n=1 Tax=Roseisolibacter agri TaxID=2014610 RepID=A0AA37QEV9_9BACT|nr:hypothetical protein [Roseisolibacter agri]GLC28561.1 hypothetical protein rosag_50740 [Roseisolibacter agri]